MCSRFASQSVVIKIIQTLQEKQFIILCMSACKLVDVNGKKQRQIPTSFDLAYFFLDKLNKPLKILINSSNLNQAQISSCSAMQYFSSFFLSISSILPKILLKLSLSRYATLTWDKALTLACLQTSWTRASSPKYSPYLYL